MLKRSNHAIYGLILILLAVIITACSSNDSTPEARANTPMPTATNTHTPTPDPPTNTPTSIPTNTPSSTPVPPTATPTATPTFTATPTPTLTPDPYAGLTVADLANRTYDGGELQIVETLGENQDFTRTLITYPSEGLTLYGFMNVPQGEGPFPVAIVMHGFIPPERYDTIAYTTRYADALARAGYLVVHPNYRNWPPSDEGPDSFRVAHAVDVLNLIATIRSQARQPGPLELANPEFIGLMGHSMGGGITLRTITVSSAVQAAVLYGSMSGDEKLNYERILAWSNGASGHEEFNTPDADLERISPIFHLDRVSVPVSIHHGDNDGTVPLEWSIDLCERLQTLGKSVECFTYLGQPHTFQGEGDQLFMQRMIDFFDKHSGR